MGNGSNGASGSKSKPEFDHAPPLSEGQDSLCFEEPSCTIGLGRAENAASYAALSRSRSQTPLDSSRKSMPK